MDFSKFKATIQTDQKNLVPDFKTMLFAPVHVEEGEKLMLCLDEAVNLMR